MNAKEEALERVGCVAQTMYAVFEKVGPQPTGFFKHTIVELDDGQKWEWTRPPYPSDERRELEREGLIRAQRERTRTNARIYEITPVGEIERQQKKYQRQEAADRKAAKEKQSGKTTTLKGMSARIAAYRKQEKELGSLSRARWIERRRRLVELTTELRRIEPMLFWDSVEKDEMEQVYEEILAMVGMGQSLLDTLDITRTDQETRALIAQLRNTNGRSAIEAEPYLRKANELEERLNYE